ncbi:MAG: hypothetical protein ACFB9M_19500 [Myxococcota bacterium]
MRFESHVEDVRLGLVLALMDRPATPLPKVLEDELARAPDITEQAPEHRVSAVRAMLRHGRYRPSGRGKPASEYLRKAARERFPRVFPAVDIINLTSLESMLPISLVDPEKLQTNTYGLRRGHAGEAYVFNAAGQTIDLQDLLCTVTLPEDQPVANPVKDSMRGKVVEGTRKFLAIVYCPAVVEDLDDVVVALERRFSAWGAEPHSAICSCDTVQLGPA